MTVLKEVQSVMSCPDRMVKTAIDLDIPVSRLEKLKDTNMVMGPDGKFISPQVFGVELPNMWAANYKALLKWKMYQEEFLIQKCGPHGMNSHRWAIEHWIKFLFENETYSKYIDDPTNLEIICRADGFPCAEGHASFMIVTLGNFGPLSKCLAFNFPIVLAEVNEKHRLQLRQAFRETVDALNTWQRNGHVEVLPGLVCKVIVHWGGDEAFLRTILGLKSCKEDLACIRCMWHRKEEYHEGSRLDRQICSLSTFCMRGSLDQVDPPMVYEGTALLPLI